MSFGIYLIWGYINKLVGREKMNPKVSIIVPVYNTGQYLSRCLESIVNQTYKNLQIIVVDDGSTDESVEIAKEFARSHSNIEIYHQQNSGVSAARNKGLQYVKGVYVFFVDSDDFILPDYIKNFVEIPDFDMPYVGGGVCTNSSEGAKTQYMTRVMGIEEFKRNCKQSWSIIPSIWVLANRYLASVIKENSLYFDVDCKCGEDVRFNVNYFKCIDKLMAFDKCEYVHVTRQGSALQSYWPNRLTEEREECQLRETLMEPEEFNWIRFLHWMIAIEHYYYWAFSRGKIDAKLKLKATINDPYFRQCIPYIIKEGTVDMKIAAWCLRLKKFGLYKRLMKILSHKKF